MHYKPPWRIEGGTFKKRGGIKEVGISLAVRPRRMAPIRLGSSDRDTIGLVV